MNDLATLYRLHAFRADRAVPPEARALPDPAKIVPYLRDQNRQALRYQVQAGYFSFDDPSAQFRRRLKGAFLITWKLLWPLRHRAKRRNERKLRRDLAAAGMPPPEDHRPQPVDDPAAADMPLSYRREVDDEID